MSGLRESGRSLTLLKGVSRLSQALGMTVVAEGIETEEQLAIVAAEESIGQAQGYLFGPPMPLPEIGALLTRVAAPVPSAPSVRPARRVGMGGGGR